MNLAAKQLNSDTLVSLFAHGPIAVCAVEVPTMRYVAANARYSQLLRTPRQAHEIVGSTVYEVLGTPTKAAMEGLRRAHEENLPTTFDTEVSECLGDHKSFLSGAFAPVQREGDATVVIAMLTEVSEHGFLTRVFHELRTPLTGLKLATQFTLKNLKKLSGEDIEAQMNLIDRKATELTKLINSWPNQLKWKNRK